MKTNLTNTTRTGFTLIETMLVLAIAVVVAIGTTGFVLNIGRGYFWASNKAQITRDVRLFTMELAAEARASNRAYVYSSFAAGDRDDVSDRRQSGQSGDCLVLVDTEPYPEADDPYHITGFVVYFRRADGDGSGPVHKLVRKFAPADFVDTSAGDFSLESTLAAAAPGDSGDYPVVVELSRGLADGRLFKAEYDGRLILVNGEIVHGNEIKEVTNTYNLSISPRG